MKTLDQLIADAQAQRAAAQDAERRMNEQRREDARRQQRERLQQELTDGLDGTFLELLDVQIVQQDVYPQTYAEFAYRDRTFWLWHYSENHEQGWAVHSPEYDQGARVSDRARTREQITELILCAIGDLLDAAQA